MAVKAIAVEGLVLSPQGIVVPGSGTLSIASSPSSKCKIQNKGVYKSSIDFTLTGASAAGYDPGTVATVGTASILASATKVKVEGGAVMRLDDENLSVSMTGTISGTPTPFVEPWKITNAAQTKVKGE